jgi:hypothetical protein
MLISNYTTIASLGVTISSMKKDTVQEIFSHPADGSIRRTEIKVVGGNITVNAHKTDAIIVQAKGDTATLGAKATLHDGVLRITSSSALRYFLQKSRIDLILTVPEDMPIAMKFFWRCSYH